MGSRRRRRRSRSSASTTTAATASAQTPAQLNRDDHAGPTRKTTTLPAPAQPQAELLFRPRDSLWVAAVKAKDNKPPQRPRTWTATASQSTSQRAAGPVAATADKAATHEDVHAVPLAPAPIAASPARSWAQLCVGASPPTGAGVAAHVDADLAVATVTANRSVPPAAPPAVQQRDPVAVAAEAEVSRHVQARTPEQAHAAPSPTSNHRVVTSPTKSSAAAGWSTTAEGDLEPAPPLHDDERSSLPVHNGSHDAVSQNGKHGSDGVHPASHRQRASRFAPWEAQSAAGWPHVEGPVGSADRRATPLQALLGMPFDAAVGSVREHATSAEPDVLEEESAVVHEASAEHASAELAPAAEFHEPVAGAVAVTPVAAVEPAHLMSSTTPKSSIGDLPAESPKPTAADSAGSTAAATATAAAPTAAAPTASTDATPPVDRSGEIDWRILMTMSEASAVIGKAGCNVSVIRDQSGCLVRVLLNDAPAPFRAIRPPNWIPSSTERVLLLRGTPTHIAKACELISLCVTHNHPIEHGRRHSSLSDIQQRFRRFAVAAADLDLDFDLEDSLAALQHEQDANGNGSGSSDKSDNEDEDDDDGDDDNNGAVDDDSTTGVHSNREGGRSSRCVPDTAFIESKLALAIPQATLRFLIHRAYLGSIIGLGGSIVHEMERASGASILAMSTPLPFSHEKVVLVRGSRRAIYEATCRLAQIVQSFPGRESIMHAPYVPCHRVPFAYSPRASYGMMHGGEWQARVPFGGSSFMPTPLAAEATRSRPPAGVEQPHAAHRAEIQVQHAPPSISTGTGVVHDISTTPPTSSSSTPSTSSSFLSTCATSSLLSSPWWGVTGGSCDGFSGVGGSNAINGGVAFGDGGMLYATAPYQLVSAVSGTSSNCSSMQGAAWYYAPAPNATPVSPLMPAAGMYVTHMSPALAGMPSHAVAAMSTVPWSPAFSLLSGPLVLSSYQTSDSAEAQLRDDCCDGSANPPMAGMAPDDAVSSGSPSASQFSSGESDAGGDDDGEVEGDRDAGVDVQHADGAEGASSTAADVSMACTCASCIAFTTSDIAAHSSSQLGSSALPVDGRRRASDSWPNVASSLPWMSPISPASSVAHGTPPHAPPQVSPLQLNALAPPFVASPLLAPQLVLPPMPSVPLQSSSSLSSADSKGAAARPVTEQRASSSAITQASVNRAAMEMSNGSNGADRSVISSSDSHAMQREQPLQPPPQWRAVSDAACRHGIAAAPAAMVTPVFVPCELVPYYASTSIPAAVDGGARCANQGVSANAEAQVSSHSQIAFVQQPNAVCNDDFSKANGSEAAAAVHDLGKTTVAQTQSTSRVASSSSASSSSATPATSSSTAVHGVMHSPTWSMRAAESLLPQALFSPPMTVRVARPLHAHLSTTAGANAGASAVASAGASAVASAGASTVATAGASTVATAGASTVATAGASTVASAGASAGASATADGPPANDTVPIKTVPSVPLKSAPPQRTSLESTDSTCKPLSSSGGQHATATSVAPTATATYARERAEVRDVRPCAPFPHPLVPPLREPVVTYPTCEFTQLFTIPSASVSAVVGKGGQHIRSIRNRTMTYISIADAPVDNPSTRVVSLTGTPANVHAAISMIRSAILHSQKSHTQEPQQQQQQQQQQKVV